jgi:hypothetical protein
MCEDGIELLTMTNVNYIIIIIIIIIIIKQTFAQFYIWMSQVHCELPVSKQINLDSLSLTCEPCIASCQLLTGVVWLHIQLFHLYVLCVDGWQTVNLN